MQADSIGQHRGTFAACQAAPGTRCRWSGEPLALWHVHDQHGRM